ncbi:endonuclease dU [Natronorubrum sp. DTA28]|uniref:endonuclease dU n=1 Tax=Natronorubrum sp. DTA28 TaxID=3447019 RepID=UPI003F86345A
MKPGVRALGIAESVRGDANRDRSTLAGAVVRADRVTDGFAYRSCTVGGTDATDAVVALLEDLERPDVRYVLLGAIAPAWYNLFDLSRIEAAADRPVIAVTFEASDGLESGLRDAFSDAALEQRLETYRSLPERRALSIHGETVYVRHVGCDAETAAEVVRAFTPEGGRPEPIRVAKVAARAGEAYLDSLE